MNKMFVPFLPPWAETGLQPAFYDVESGTVLQQTARMYDKVNQLTRLFNEFSESVTNEVNSFEQNVNDIVDEYIEKFNQLHDYVYDYFDNLDVQEEINNKLDAMAEDGTLSDIISEYLNSIAIFGYDTVADMVASENLIAGSYARTNGFYSQDDGCGALYKIRLLEGAETADGMGVIAITGSSIDGLVAEIVIEGDKINAGAFGIVGDGTHDDAVNIQYAIDKACEYIQTRPTSTGAFGGPITVVLPDKKMYIKTQISSNEAIKIVGGGTSSTLVLADDINYMIKADKDANTKTRNEETQIEGLEISNLRFDGSSRGYTCTSAIGVYHCDHFVLRDLWFMCIKGKCIELAGAREGNVESIFTRFCGVYGSGCIEIVTNPNIGADTSNLNFGNNWNIVYPFGAAIKFVDGEFSYINNILIHGMFDGVINSLSTYFGTNDYQDTNNDFIVLSNSSPAFQNLETVYAPDNSVYVNMTNSKGKITNAHFGGHKSNQESQSTGRFFTLSTNSTLYIDNVTCTMGNQNADLFIVDGTSKVTGSMINTNNSDINTDLIDYKRATRFAFEGERNLPAYLGYSSRGDTHITSGNVFMRANMYLGATEPDDTLTLNQNAMYIGTNQYRTRTIVGIPDEGYFVLPKCTTSGLSYTANHAIFFDENDNLKVMLWDADSQTWGLKTITLS